MVRHIFAVALLVRALVPSTVRADDVSFAFDVRPILSDHCFACHGFDENKREAELRLDTYAGATVDLGGYQAITPGSLGDSELWSRVINKDDEVMPPEEFHKPLTAAQIEILRKWILQGADYDDHWAFVAPEQVDVPRLPVANPIDAFVQARLAREGLKPNQRADKATLIRRVTLDLTGLPPTVEETQRFLDNDSPGALETVVDGLLSRPAYGEHMSRSWLDLARYADTHGLHLDNERSMWPYRDWVVKALNDNLPFDDFTRWQLAGDLLSDPTEEQLVASGFNRCNVTTSEGGSINDEWIFRYAVDRTATAVEVWMGLTAGCAVCHDHKFDPLSTKEFYSMYAFFHSAADPAMDGNIVDTPPILKLVSDVDKRRLAELRGKMATLDDELVGLLKQRTYEDPAMLAPRPRAEEATEIWFDDVFPDGITVESNGGHKTTYVTREEGPVFSGDIAIKRVSNSQVSQDYFAKGADFVVPDGGKFFVYCYLDSKDFPETIMLQMHTTSWKNRAVWGAADKIPFGKAGTTEKVQVGDLPAADKWVRLEVDAKKIGLAAGTHITGLALTQFGGTVYWDRLGVDSRIDKASDPAWSWSAYLAQDYSLIRKSLPDHLRRRLQGITPEKWGESEADEVRQLWLRNIYAGNREIVAEHAKKTNPISDQIDAIESAAPLTFVMADLKEPRESFVMLRGEYDNPGEQVTRNVPAFLPPLPEKGGAYDRLDFANWLLDPEHPLTARVTVNRFWQQFFGAGIVETSADFGAQGQPPSHPELLDWMAVQFVKDGWDMKRFVKRIVTSDTYCQSARASESLSLRDPMNRLYARGPRLRLDAEVLRDQALFVGGLLNTSLGGPGVRPYQPENIWEPVGFGNSNTRNYKQDSGAKLYRRSLYTFLKRTAPPPFMSSFDGPSREQSCSVRGRSNTPMQALQLLNDIQHVEAARGLAARMLVEGGSTQVERIGWAWQTLMARQPSADEVAVCEKVLLRQLAKYKSDSKLSESLLAVGEMKASGELSADELAAYTVVANMLLNLDEVVCKN